MRNLEIVPNWLLSVDKSESLHKETIALLNAIAQKGKLTEAAKQVDMSYRHAWNLLNEGERLLGFPLVSKQKGKGATLTPVGSALLRFNQRLEARIHPQFESLSTELNIELRRAAEELAPVVKVYASHGFAVALLPSYARECQIEMHYQHPVEALTALTEGRCRVAGFHVSVGTTVDSLRARYRALLNPQKFSIVRFIRRQQGWMCAPDKQIDSLKDIVERDLRFINREANSGTRELFDQLLKNHDIGSSQILGYQSQEFTHSAIAAHIASNMADVGFGVQAAASRFGLGFTPVVEEAYIWAFLKGSEEENDLAAFIRTLKNVELHEAIEALPGYRCDASGELAPIEWALSL